MCYVYANMWDILIPFWRRVRWLSKTKNFLLPCFWNLNGILIILGRHMAAKVSRFVVDGAFFLSLFSLSSPQNFALGIQNFRFVLLVIDISTLVFILFISSFTYWPFFKKSYLFSILFFNPNLLYIILLIYILIWSLFFWFLFFILDHFIKILFIFNFILQTQFVIFFSIWSLIFWFLFFCSWSFSKFFICFQFHHSNPICDIFFQFGPYSFDFYFFVLDPFVNFLFIFNFILQS